MSRIPQDASEVHAPDETLAWAESYGWIRHSLDLDAVRERGDDVVVLVDDDRWVRNLTGPAPLAAVVRVDRDLQELADRFEEFLGALVNLAEENRGR
jgi:hypothetical protein